MEIFNSQTSVVIQIRVAGGILSFIVWETVFGLVFEPTNGKQ